MQKRAEENTMPESLSAWWHMGSWHTEDEMSSLKTRLKKKILKRATKVIWPHWKSDFQRLQNTDKMTQVECILLSTSSLKTVRHI